MPPKLNVTPESVASKSTAKSKKRTTKIKRNTKSAIKTKDSSTNSKKLENKKSGNISTVNNSFSSSFSGSNNMRISLSEIVMSKGVGINKSDKSLNTSGVCKYRCCSCKPLKITEKVDKLMQAGSKDRISNNRTKDIYSQQDFKKYSLTKKRSSQENLHLLTSSRLYNEPKHSLNFPRYNNRGNYLESPISSNDSLNCQHAKTYVYKCSLVSPQEIPSMKCNCTCCRKISTFRSKANKNSFSSSQSCPQLDVIKEEDSEVEDFQNKVRQGTVESSLPKKRQSQVKITNSETLKGQRTLEDSCADFLNIVCDNIMESVEKSVDTKLKQFTNHSNEKLENLGEKLEKNEQVMRSFYYEMMEKMTKQNETNFEKLYKLIENLLETKTAANQFPKSKNTYQDNECQYDEPIMEQEYNIIKENHYDSNRNENETNNLQVKMKGCDCCQCPVEGYPTHTLVVNKSLPNKTLIVANLLDEHNVKTNAHRNDKQTGSEMENDRGKEIKEVEKTKNLNSRDLNPKSDEDFNKNMILRKFPPATVDSLQTDLNSKVTNLQQKEQFPMEHNSVKEITNKNSFPIRQTKKQENKVNSGQKPMMSSSYFNNKPEQEPTIFPKFPNFYDNYDTSGYATEPEDNEHQASNSGRKKLQKKASKQNYNSPSSEHITLSSVTTGRGQDKHKQKKEDSDHSIRKKGQISNAKDTKASSTRLSRL